MRSISAHSGTLRGGVRRWIGVCALVLLAAGQSVHGQSASGLRVVPLVRDDRVLVSFELRDGYTPEIRAAILSGLRTTFTYAVDLRLDVSGWVDRTIGTAVVTTSVEYDNRLRKHQIERRIDGRIEDALVTEDEDVVRQWLTNMKQLELFPTSLLQENREYYVRVNASARPGQGSILWPFGSGTSAQAKFTFIR